MPKRKNPKSSQAKGSLSTASAAPKPSWPQLKPLIPTADLALETVLPGQIVVARKLFPASLCQSLVAFLASLPLATTPGVPKKGEAVRVNDRFEVQDAVFAERLWRETALQELVAGSEGDWGGEVCGLNPRIRVYRYSKGQFLDQHCESKSLVADTD